MFKAAVGHGIDPDSLGAIAEALEQCQEALDGKIPQAGILMAAIDFDHVSLLDYVQNIYPDILLIGGTSVGEMSSKMAFQQDSLTLMLFYSDTVTFSAGVGYCANKDPKTAAAMAIDSALQSTTKDPEDIKLCYTLCEGLGVDGSALVQGLRAATNNAAPIYGGFVGDDYQFEATYQFYQGEVLQNAVVVLTFFGNLHVSYGVANGQRPLGRKGVVTRSKGSTIYEVDNKPAKYFYADYIDEGEEVKIDGGTSFSRSIAVFEPEEHDFYVRSPHGETEDRSGINYFGSVPEHSVIQLTDADCESLVDSAQQAFSKAKETYPGVEPEAVLLVSCVSRMKNLGTQVHREYSVVEESIGSHIPNVGFYSYGEISPFTAQNNALFHNETFTALLLGTR